VTVTVVAFARLRELLGFSERSIRVPDSACIDDVWTLLVADAPSVAELRDSTRIACNGALAPGTHALEDGDDLALLPPVSGG
jgi:molybdopterin synthase sulfur carrier subunit